MPLIGLSGYSRCGKDTVAQILVDNYGYEQRVLADPIRKILLEINPIIGWDEVMGSGSIRLLDVMRHGWDWIKKEFPLSVDYMISLGQAARDHIDEDIWLTPVMKDLQARTVISDVRQVNEAKRIKDMGGVLWRISRPGTVPRAMDKHLDDWKFDGYIYNDRDLLSLEDAVHFLYEGTVGLESH